jgi:hypothetical protein
MTRAERSLKVLVVWELGANLGHLLRLLPVIKALKVRGHEVALAVPDPAQARLLLQMPDVECTACPMVRPRGESAGPQRAVHCYADTLIDSDGAGTLMMDGTTLSGGKASGKRDIWSGKDSIGNFESYALYDDSASSTGKNLVITRRGRRTLSHRSRQHLNVRNTS